MYAYNRAQQTDDTASSTGGTTPRTTTTTSSSTHLDSLLTKLRPFQRTAFNFAVHGDDGGENSSNTNSTTTGRCHRQVVVAGAGTGRILLGDEMGLGKTLTSLAIMLAYQSTEWPLLILCPASLRYTWPSEIEKFCPWIPSSSIYCVRGSDDVQFASQIYRWRSNHHNQKQQQQPPPPPSSSKTTKANLAQPHWKPLKATKVVAAAAAAATTTTTTTTTTAKKKKKCPIQIVIVTYSLLQTRFQVANTLRECNFECIIADESHNLKQINSQRCQLALPLLQGSKRLVLLSGTPALNRPVELWPQLHALDARGTLFCDNNNNNNKGMSYNEYTKRYCNAHRTRFGYDVKGVSNAEELHACLKSVMIRRLKSDVLQDLPSKQRTIIPVSIMDVEKEQESRETMAQLRLARRAVTEITDLDADDVAKSAQWEARKLLMQAYQASGIAKAPSTTEYILDWLEGSDSTQKLVVFAHHKDVLDYIESSISKKYKGRLGMIRIDGSVSPAERALRVKKFQSNATIRLALLSMTAAGVGLTLTAASNIVFAELHWTPGILAQAEDRCHRIGQASSVNVMYCICKDAEVSIDMTLWSMLSSKVGNLGRVVDGERGQLDAVEKDVDRQFVTPRRNGSSSSVEEDLTSFFASSKKSSGTKRNTDSIVNGTIQSFFMKQSGKKKKNNHKSLIDGDTKSTSNVTTCISLLEDDDDDDVVRPTSLTNGKSIRVQNKKKQKNDSFLTGEGTSDVTTCISLLEEDDDVDIGRYNTSAYETRAYTHNHAVSNVEHKISFSGKFVCHRCTFKNEADVIRCVVCETPRACDSLQADSLPSSYDMCGTINSSRYVGKDRTNTTIAEKTFNCGLNSDGNAFDDDDDELDESDLAAIDSLTKNHLTQRRSTTFRSSDFSVTLRESREDNEVLSFTVSLNTGRIALHLLSSGQPLHVNFEITQLLTKQSADELETLHFQRQVPNSTIAQAKQHLSYDDGAIRQLLSALDTNTLNISCQDNLKCMCEEVKQYISCYLNLREVEKKVVMESGQAATASSLKQLAASLLVSTITGTTERFQGGAKERAVANIKNGCATVEDVAVVNGQGCSWCAKPFYCGKGTYCSQSCVEEGRVRRGGMFSSSKIREQLFALEHGKCTKCGINAHSLFCKLKSLHPAERLNALLNANWKLPKTRQATDRLLNDPQERDFWQADHEMAVAEGGGSTGLDNLRTLCTPCHGVETEKLLARLKTLPSSASSDDSRSQMDMFSALSNMNKTSSKRRRMAD